MDFFAGGWGHFWGHRLARKATFCKVDKGDPPPNIAIYKNNKPSKDIDISS